MAGKGRELTFPLAPVEARQRPEMLCRVMECEINRRQVPRGEDAGDLRPVAAARPALQKAGGSSAPVLVAAGRFLVWKCLPQIIRNTVPFSRFSPLARKGFLQG